jgi:hypothetical protein
MALQPSGASLIGPEPPIKHSLSLWMGVFVTRSSFTKKLDRIELLCRCRKDARLQFAAPKGQRRFYAAESFTPEEVRQDPKLAWEQSEVYHGGSWRTGLRTGAKRSLLAIT